MLPFPDKYFTFSSAKISDDLFLVQFPPVSQKLLFPLLSKIPPCFQKIHLLFTYFMCILFPLYFDHDAFMHHPMHVLFLWLRNCGVAKAHIYMYVDFSGVWYRIRYLVLYVYARVYLYIFIH